MARSVGRAPTRNRHRPGWRRGAIRHECLPHHQSVTKRSCGDRRRALLCLGDNGVPDRLGECRHSGEPPAGVGRPTRRVPSGLRGLRGWHPGLRGRSRDARLACRTSRTGCGGWTAGRACLCRHQFGAATGPMDSGIGTHLGDVGCWNLCRSRGRRSFRPMGALAVGIRDAGGHHRGDCRDGALRVDARAKAERRACREPGSGLVVARAHGGGQPGSGSGAPIDVALHGHVARRRRRSRDPLRRARSSLPGIGTAEGGIRAQSAEVDLLDDRGAGGGLDGRDVHSLLRAAARTSEPCRCRILGRHLGIRMDCRRNDQRVGPSADGLPGGVRRPGRGGGWAVSGRSITARRRHRPRDRVLGTRLRRHGCGYRDGLAASGGRSDVGV